MTGRMSEHYTESEVLAAIPRLTRVQLATFVETQVIVPLQTGGTVLYRQIDIARMELLCDLSDGFDLDEDALGIVISLLDQLHEARRDLRLMAEALAAEPPDVRARIAALLA